MPVAQTRHGGRRRGTGGINGRFGAEMLNYAEIPGIAVLVAQDDIMARHRRIGRLPLEGLAVIGRFTEGSFGQMHVVNVSTRRATRHGSSGRGGLRERKGGKASRGDWGTKN